MINEQNLLGVKSPGDEMEIREFKRIVRVEEIEIGLFDGSAGTVITEVREVPLNAWSGITGCGTPVHVSYRLGELTIEVDLPGTSGGLQPLTILRWSPRLALGLITPVHQQLGEAPKPLREELVRQAERNAQFVEIRSINNKERLISESELRFWMVERNRCFALLRGMQQAGGELRFRLVSAESRHQAA